MRWACFALLALLLVACAEREDDGPPAPAAVATAEVRRALWVLAEGSHRALQNAARIDQLVDIAASSGFTDLFVQVYRRGRSWFPSTHADDSPYRALKAASGISPLQRLLERAHARDLRVHAWFNALSLAQNDGAPLLQSVGTAAVHVDRQGRSMLDYPENDVPPPDRRYLRLGTPGVWLDPAVPGVIEYLEQTVDDLVQAAPGLDGLHLDYIRHPLVLPIVPGSRFDLGLDFGYSAQSRERFERERETRFRRGDAWDHFRRDQVSETVRRLGERLPEGCELSAAVLPWAERAYLVAMQDWRRWLEEGWVDFVVAMAYTRDDRLLRYLVHGLRGGVGGERVWMGLGSWLFMRSSERIHVQIDLAQSVAPPGIVLFSYDALIAAPEILEGLRWTSE